jgi:hypothetical protein
VKTVVAAKWRTVRNRSLRCFGSRGNLLRETPGFWYREELFYVTETAGFWCGVDRKKNIGFLVEGVSVQRVSGVERFRC